MDGYSIKDMRMTLGESAKQVYCQAYQGQERIVEGKSFARTMMILNRQCHGIARTTDTIVSLVIRQMDIVDYYCDFEHMETVEAAKRLLELLGAVPIMKAIEKKKTFTDINDVKYEPLGEKAIKYMESRGISKATLDVFGVKQSRTHSFKRCLL